VHELAQTADKYPVRDVRRRGLMCTAAFGGHMGGHVMALLLRLLWWIRLLSGCSAGNGLMAKDTSA